MSTSYDTFPLMLVNHESVYGTRQIVNDLYLHFLSHGFELCAGRGIRLNGGFDMLNKIVRAKVKKE
jgi:hypothetical protein